MYRSRERVITEPVKQLATAVEQEKTLQPWLRWVPTPMSEKRKPTTVFWRGGRGKFLCYAGLLSNFWKRNTTTTSQRKRKLGGAELRKGAENKCVGDDRL